MSAVLPQPQTTGLAKIFHQINKLEAIEHDVIALLPTLTDDEVIETRNTARLLFASAWKIEVACDAEIWDRTKRAMNGRGNKDVDEKGIMAAVNKRAQDLGCGASTVLKNAQIFKRFKKTLTTESILDDKGFFQAALASNDPDATIEVFAQKKMDNPHYKVADAWRDIEAEKEQARQDREQVAGAVRSMQQKAMLIHCDHSISIQLDLQKKCPMPKIGDRIYSSIIQELQDIKQDIQTANIEVAIKAAVDNGYQTVPDIVKHLGLQPDDVRRVLSEMVEKTMLEVRSVEESRQDGRRGVMVNIYGVNPDYAPKSDD